MRSIIINGIIVTANKENQVIRNGYLIFEDDKIVEVEEGEAHLSGFDQIIDAQDNIVMPGLINTHSHSPMSLLRGYGDDLSLKEWLEQKIWPIERQFTEEHIVWGTQLSLLEMLKSGTTTYSDMYIFMETVAEAVKISGIRANLSRGIIGFGSLEQKTQKLNEALNFSKNWNRQAQGRITTMMSPHSVYTCSPDLIEDIIDAAKEAALPIQIHLAETANEVKQNIKEYGFTPVEHLFRLGLFEHPTLIAHAVHVNKEEIKLLNEYDVKISHNPGSNLKLGSGIAPVSEMLKQGINVSLGTDSAASNNNLDLFEEMRLAALIHKGFQQDPVSVSANTAVRMATIFGAESLFINQYTGSLEAGKKADFIIVNTKQAHFQPLYDPISSLVYSASGQDVKDVFVDGKQLVKDRAVQTLDEERILYEVKRLSKQWY